MHDHRLSTALSVFTCVVAVGLFTAITTTTTTAAAAPPDPCEQRDRHPDRGPPPECVKVIHDDATVNGVDAVTFWKLWDGDRDDAGELALEDREDFDSVTSYEYVRGWSVVTDYPFYEPPAATETWNRNDHGDFNGGSRRKSVYPRGTRKERDTEWAGAPGEKLAIRGAYVKIFSTDPTTVVHSGGRTERLVAPEGTVRAISDYRVIKPDFTQRTLPSGTILIWTYTGFNHNRRTTLSIDGVPAGRDRTEDPVFQFNGLRPGDEVTFKVETDITARVTESKYRIQCTPGSGCSPPTLVSREPLGVDVSQTRTMRATVYEAPSAEAREYEFSSGDHRGMLLSFDDHWGSITLGDTTVHSGWRFYTESRDDWGEMKTSTNLVSSPLPEESSVRPIETHAYTVNATDIETEGNAPGKWTVVSATGRNHRGTTRLPGRIDPAWSGPDSPHLSVRDLRVQSTFDEPPGTSSGEVVGLVAGQTSPVSLDGPETVHDVTVRVKSKTAVNDSLEYEFEAVDDDGNPVEGGTLVVNGTGYRVPDDGIVTATVDGDVNSFRAEYRPEDWSGDGPYYTGDDLVVPISSSEVPSPAELFAVATEVFVVLVPFMLSMVALDYMLGTRFFRDSLPSVHDAFQGVYDAIRERRRR
jgi:hypothetical protein